MSAIETKRRRPDLSAVDQHLLLTRDMARRHGVDLSVAMYQGFLTRLDFAAMVTRCRECQGTPEDCRDFQEDHQNATAAPDWCANRAVLEGLRDLV
jgi:antirestriction protein